jgi:hypothetical protein
MKDLSVRQSWDPVAWARRRIEWERRAEELVRRSEETNGAGGKPSSEKGHRASRTARTRIRRRNRRAKPVIARA